MAPTYRQRLRVEGLVLASCGAIGTLATLPLAAQATRGPASTIGQLVAVAVLLAWLGPRSARRAMQRSQPLSLTGVGSGEPTPLWQLPLIVVVLSVPVGLLGGWDAGLRVTAGCVLVGIAQALLLERAVAAEERTSGRRYFRVAGSRILRGTNLGHVPPRG